MIISARGIGGPLERVQNGKLSAVTSVSGFFVGPHFLDERRFMYFSRDNRGSGTIEVGSLDGSTSTPRGLPAVQAASYTNGYVVFATPAGNLNAMRFDAKELTTSGGSFVLADRVGVERRYPGLGTLSTSASGAVAYRESAVANRQMMWMDRNGELVGTIGGADSASPGNPRVSPDGQVILFFRQTGSALGSVWVMDAQSRVQRQIQDGANTAIWSPTGDRILFAALRGGGARGGALGPLMIERPITAAAGSGAGTQVGPTTGVAFPEDWNPNGAVIYRTGLGAGAGGGDLFVVPPNNGSPVPVAQTLASERSGRFSPDGKWIAYQSDETGRNEVYVQPFPGTMGQRQRVSLNGGTSPQWGRKGRELYFISGDNKLMLAGASSGEFDTPKPLFKSPLPQGAEYDTVLDGDRFLILAPIEETPPIIVLNNWMR
jgi:hypothetical protein